MNGPDRLRAALRRLRPKPPKAKAAPPAWGTDEWALHVETRLAAIEAQARHNRIIFLALLAATGLLERAASLNGLQRVLDLLK